MSDWQLQWDRAFDRAEGTCPRWMSDGGWKLQWDRAFDRAEGWLVPPRDAQPDGFNGTAHLIARKGRCIADLSGWSVPLQWDRAFDRAEGCDALLVGWSDSLLQWDRAFDRAEG